MPGSVTNWIEVLRAGDHAVAQELWNRYFQRMVGLARKKLQGSPVRFADPEDAALSAFDSFCRGAQKGNFPRLQDRNDLWGLLVVITARKALDLVEHEGREKRGGGRVLTEAALADLASASASVPGLDQVIGREPTPEFAAQVAEEFSRLLKSLEDTEIRSVAVWKMEGHDNNDIAAKLGCVPRTVERKLQSIRSIWIEKGLAKVAPPAESLAAVTLTVTHGPHQGKQFSLDGHATFLVGRSKHVHFQIKDRYFSRIHFMVEVNPPQCRLVDMKSLNGTSVNGQEVTRVDLRDGDRIKAGHTILQVSIPAPAQAADSNPELRESAERGSAERAPRSCAPALPLPGILEPKKARSRSQPHTQSPALCLACGNPAIPSSPKTSNLCSACQELIRQHPQPIPSYQLIRELGRGAMGVVYLASAPDNLVAVKMITAAGTGSRSQVARFLREAAILGKLWHPHIVVFRDMGESNLRAYFVMEYVKGNDAARLVKTQGPLAVGRAVGLICQLLDALTYAHAQGFVHRDIKPSNNSGSPIASVDGAAENLL